MVMMSTTNYESRERSSEDVGGGEGGRRRSTTGDLAREPSSELPPHNGSREEGEEVGPAKK